MDNIVSLPTNGFSEIDNNFHQWSLVAKGLIKSFKTSLTLIIRDNRKVRIEIDVTKVMEPLSYSQTIIVAPMNKREIEAKPDTTDLATDHLLLTFLTAASNTIWFLTGTTKGSGNRKIVVAVGHDFCMYEFVEVNAKLN